MNLQKKLIQLSEYKCSFKYVDSYFLVSMTYPNGWSVIPSEDRTIEVAEEEGVTFYAAPIETDIEKAFSLIDDTIMYNLDVEKKMSLLKYNIGKLQELFAERDLEELETIEFVFKPKKIDKPKLEKPILKKKTRKQAVKKIKKDKIEITQDEEIVETTNDIEIGWDDNSVEEPSLVEPIVTTENKYLEEIDR